MGKENQRVVVSNTYNKFSTEEINHLFAEAAGKPFNIADFISGNEVNISRIAQDFFGIKVAMDEKMDSDTSGKIDMTAKQITVNFFQHTHRQRFTIAHEISHYIFHQLYPDKFADLQEVFRSENNVHYEGWQDMQNEIDANQLASSILMPSDLLRGSIHSWTNQHSSITSKNVNELVDDLSEKFNVSPASLIYHVKNFRD